MDRTNLTKALFRKGVLVDLHVICWTGQVQVTPKDVGLESFPEDLMSLGRKRLIPKDVAEAPIILRASAERKFEEYSLPFPLSRARFVPVENLKTAINFLNHYKRRFDESVRTVINNIDTYKTSMQDVWEEAIERHFNGRVNKEEMLARIMRAYPTQSRLLRRYYFGWTLFEITAPNLQTEIAEIAKLEKTEEELNKAVEATIAEYIGILWTKLNQIAEHTKKSIDVVSGNMNERSKNAILKDIEELRTLNFFKNERINEFMNRMKGGLDTKALGVAKEVTQTIDEIANAKIDDINAEVEKAVASLTSFERTIEL